MCELLTVARDPEHLYRRTLATACASLASVQDSARGLVTARQVAREALQEAGSCLPQAAFFACLHALGGHEAVIHRISAALKVDA